MTASPRSADLRERLVTAGLDELRENGLAAVSIRAVARRTGVSHAAPGYVFGDRAGLLTAMGERGFELLREHLVSTVVRSRPADGAVVDVGEAYLDFARREPAVYRLLFDTEELHRDDPSFASAGAAAFDALIERLPTPGGSAAEAQLSPLLAWAVVHGLAGLERSGALGAQFASDADRAHAELSLLQWVASAIGRPAAT